MAKKKRPGMPPSGIVTVAILKLTPDLEKQIRAMATELGMPLAIYLRCLVKQHLKTPLQLSTSPAARTA